MVSVEEEFASNIVGCWHVTEAEDLIRRCLSIDQSDRPSLNEVLDHPWMQHSRTVMIADEEDDDDDDDDIEASATSSQSWDDVGRSTLLMSAGDDGDMYVTSLTTEDLSLPSCHDLTDHVAWIPAANTDSCNIII